MSILTSCHNIKGFGYVPRRLRTAEIVFSTYADSDSLERLCQFLVDVLIYGAQTRRLTEKVRRETRWAASMG